MFDIILPFPYSLGVKDETDLSLGGAIEAVFPSLDDYVIMVWNEIPVYLSCRYDMSIIINDIVYIVDELLKKQDFSFKNTWPSNTFYTLWKITSIKSEVSIEADWFNVIGDEDALNENNRIVVAKVDFLNKLCSVLDFVSRGVDQVGYTTKDLRDYGNLLRVLRRAKKLTK